MTSRKLTPAEALEVFRDWRAVERADMTSTAFYGKWGTFDRAVSDAIDALEEALAQKPPAAPVPSDKEIVGWLELCRTSANLEPAVWMTLMHLARRIGVQGVPQ